MKIKYAANRTTVCADRKKRHRADPRQQMLIASRKRARYANLPHTITVDDIVIPAACPVLGIKLVVGGNRDSSPSLDRLVGELGYVPRNVVVISYRANRMKNDATLAELKQLVDFLTTAIRKLYK